MINSEPDRHPAMLPPAASPGHGPGTAFGPPQTWSPPTVQPSGPPRVRTLLAATALAAVLGAGTGVGGYALLAATPTIRPAASVSTVPVNLPPALDGSVTAAAAGISPSVVTITVQSRSGESVGSGVILDTEGHILTNEHVVADARGGSLTVTFDDGSTASATVVGTSAANDLAVIKVTGASAGQLRPAAFAPSSSVVTGMAVVAVGAPLGLSETVTSGIVSATARPVRSGTSGEAVYQAVQTDAAINPGNSGGPLVNLNGQVVGINAAGASLSGGGQSGSIGLGFAIPSDVAVRVANDLIADGVSPDASLGVRLQVGDAGSDTTATGVTLASVVAGKAADRAGLRAGDVVTRVGEIPTPTADGLIAAVRFHAPGEQVTLRYLRDGRPGEATVTLGSA
jgi:putative serine protease PepD